MAGLAQGLLCPNCLKQTLNETFPSVFECSSCGYLLGKPFGSPPSYATHTPKPQQKQGRYCKIHGCGTIIPQHEDYCLAHQNKCSICGTPTGRYGGNNCFACTLNKQKAAQKSSRFGAFWGSSFRVRPGSSIPIENYDDLPNDLPKPAEWTKEKEAASQLGIPWNFYQGLLQIAKSLQDKNGLLSASIDPKGYLKLVYSGYTVMCKIVEIDVEGNDK